MATHGVAVAKAKRLRSRARSGKSEGKKTVKKESHLARVASTY